MIITQAGLILLHLSRSRFLKNKFEMHNIPYTVFREPDMNNEITAIATDVNNRFIKKLNLL